MTGPGVAALALSAVLLIRPSSRSRVRPGASTARRSRSTQRTRGSSRPALLAVTGCAAACFAAGLAAVLPATTVLAAASLGATAGRRHRRKTRRRRAAEEAVALHGALDVLIGELRAGIHPVPAFEAAAAETDQPAVAAGLRTVAARARLGADVPAGLRSIARSSPLPAQWELLAAYWRLSCDRGLAISTLMHAAQRDIGERQRFSARLDAGMAGARASATILATLPALGVLLGQLIGAEPVSFLLGDRAGRDGGGLLLAGVLLVCTGLVWSDRITERVG